MIQSLRKSVAFFQILIAASIILYIVFRMNELITAIFIILVIQSALTFRKYPILTLIYFFTQLTLTLLMLIAYVGIVFSFIYLFFAIFMWKLIPLVDIRTPFFSKVVTIKTNQYKNKSSSTNSSNKKEEKKIKKNKNNKVQDAEFSEK